MTKTEFLHLKTGDIVRTSNGEAYIVTQNYNGRVTVAKTHEITNPNEWQLIFKANMERK
jgi:hypothetical protein